MSKELFEGTGVALVTPFHASGKVDFKALEKVTNHVIDGGLDYLVALGTTSEAPVLTQEEKNEVVKCIVDTNAGRVPVIMGYGGNNTMALVEGFKTQNWEGVDGILCVAPYYNKPSQEGMYEHFAAIAEVCHLPIMLYNVPGRTSSNISSETALELATNFENIKAIKEASGNFEQVMDLIDNRPEDFKVVSGDDALTLGLMAIGMDGVVSVMANAYPKEMSDMVNAILVDMDLPAARNLHYRMLTTMNAIFEQGSPGGIKALMEHMDLLKNHVRLPLVEVSRSLSQELKLLLDEFQA